MNWIRHPASLLDDVINLPEVGGAKKGFAVHVMKFGGERLLEELQE